MADALASGASVRKDVGVQVPPRAPNFRFLKQTRQYQCLAQKIPIASPSEVFKLAGKTQAQILGLNKQCS
jgi:hypothetical protein